MPDSSGSFMKSYFTKHAMKATLRFHTAKFIMLLQKLEINTQLNSLIIRIICSRTWLDAQVTNMDCWAEKMMDLLSHQRDYAQQTNRRVEQRQKI